MLTCRWLNDIDLVIVMTLAENVVNSTYNNIILLDVVSEYELKMNSRLEMEAGWIESQIQHIKEITNENEMNRNIQKLIKSVREWVRIAKPIQLVAKSKGISYGLSKKLGLSLRTLAIYLFTEKYFTQQAFEIVNTMKPLFEEFEPLVAILNEDSKAIKKKIIEKKTVEEENFIIEKTKELKTKGQSLIFNPSQENIDSFIDYIATIDNTIKAFHVSNYQKKKKMREELCVLSREVARDLYRSNKENIELVYKFVLELFSRFSNTDLSVKLKVDVSMLKTAIERNNEEYRKQKAEKERKEKRKKVWKVLSVVSIICGILCWVIIASLNQQGSSKNIYKSNTGIETNTPAPTASPKPMYVYNGKMLITPEYECVSPFEIIADSNTDYYIYLKYQRAPSNTTEKRSLKSKATYPYEGDIAFYLKAGKSVSINVPIGIYKLYYATGSTFFDTNLLFGNTTKCYDSDDLLSFYADSEYYRGHTITLKPVSYGNFDTDSIKKSEFPTR